jgi:hypothetical protein
VDLRSLRSALDDPRPVQRWTRNPFYVLELSTEASWSEIERQGEALHRRLAGGDDADGYATPAGPRRRTLTDVDAAVEALRDPDVRIVHELWASVPSRSDERAWQASRAPTWTEAMSAFGWRRR